MLLDECLPRKLKRALPEYEVRTVPEAGWAGRKNGELLHLAQDTFDVFITIDQNMHYQQNLTGFSLAVMLLRARDSRLVTLLPLMPEVRARLARIQPGETIQIGAPTLAPPASVQPAEE